MQLGRRRSLLRLENFDERRIGKDSCRSHGVLGRLGGRSWGLGGQTWWMSLLLLPLQIALIPLAALVPLGSLVAGVKNPESPGDTVANRYDDRPAMDETSPGASPSEAMALFDPEAASTRTAAMHHSVVRSLTHTYGGWQS
jgi:hypothetical protein